jgi:hypothetical protein
VKGGGTRGSRGNCVTLCMRRKKPFQLESNFPPFLRVSPPFATRLSRLEVQRRTRKCILFADSDLTQTASFVEHSVWNFPNYAPGKKESEKIRLCFSFFFFREPETDRLISRGRWATKSPTHPIRMRVSPCPFLGLKLRVAVLVRPAVTKR